MYSKKQTVNFGKHLKNFVNYLGNKNVYISDFSDTMIKIKIVRINGDLLEKTYNIMTEEEDREVDEDDDDIYMDEDGMKQDKRDDTFYSIIHSTLQYNDYYDIDKQHLFIDACDVVKHYWKFYRQNGFNRFHFNDDIVLK
jgi:hypothetical protein